MKSKDFKNYRLQYIMKHDSPGKKEYSFGTSLPNLSRVNMAKVLMFVRTLQKIQIHLKGKWSSATFGIKIINIKNNKIYGAYSLFKKRTIKNTEELKFMRLMIDEVEKIHAELEKNLKKYRLPEGYIPKPFNVI